MLERPLAERLSYDATQNLFFVNFDGLAVRSHADIERIRHAVEEKLAGVGHRVRAIVNYDRFAIAPELVDEYIDMVRSVVERHYHDVTRYTTNVFLRMQLAEALERHRTAPHLFASAEEARASLT
jgi:propionate CoA-transferase